MKSVLWCLMGLLLLAAGCKEDATKDTSKDKDNDTEKSTDEETSDENKTVDIPEGCPEGHDPKNPALRVTGYVPTAPKPFVEIASGIQTAVDDGSSAYLFSLSDIEGDGEVDGELGVADEPNADDTYAFKGESESVTIELDGDKFKSTGDVNLDMTIPVFGGEPITITMQEVVIEGTFEDETRCAIGELLNETSPTEWETGGSMRGKLTVADTKAANIEVTTPIAMTFSLCAYFAYGLSDALKLTADPNCEADPAGWTHPPDAVVGDEDAWIVSADIAAVGVMME